MNENVVYSCKYFQHLVNQGIWWCEKQLTDKTNPIYLNCDCKNCNEPREKVTITTVTSENNLNERKT